MGYTQRLIIGVLVAIYAYSLFQDANQRFQFHQTISKISQKLQISECYCWSQQVRNTIAAFIFASGICLVLDVSTRIAIISELFLFLFSASTLNGCFCYGKIQSTFIHLLMLLVLLANTKSQSAQPVKILSKISEGKVNQAANKGANNTKREQREQRFIRDQGNVGKEQAAGGKRYKMKK